MATRIGPFVIVCAALLVGGGALRSAVAAPPALDRLLAAYKTAPQDYPSGKDSRGRPYAAPDTGTWFAWHFYDARAAAHFAEAPMDTVGEVYNPLEGEGVGTDRGSAVTFEFVAEQATEGQRAVKVRFPAAAVEKGQPLRISPVGSPSYNPGYNADRLVRAGYWPHFRWVKLDVFNPQEAPVAVSLEGVPLVLPPGPSVLAARTVDADSGDGAHAAIHIPLRLAVRSPAQDVTLYLDNVRMEQEAPRLLRSKGRMFHFAPRSADLGKIGAPLAWPGCTVVQADSAYDAAAGFGWTAEAPPYNGATFRSHDNGLLWGSAGPTDQTPFRVDLPAGRYGVYVFAYPGPGWAALTLPKAGQKVAINGKDYEVYPPLDDTQAHQRAYSGEAWDYRPGYCFWSELVAPVFFPAPAVLDVDAPEGHLLFQFPKGTSLRALMIFPQADKDAAMREIGRWNRLLAESWDVTHARMRGPRAEEIKYIGFHEESSRPETIPQRLAALNLAEAHWQRGVLPFVRGLTEPVYPDTIPTPAEAAVRELSAFAVPGQSVVLTLGLLPLAERAGVTVSATALAGPGGATIAASAIDLRWSRMHAKTMEYGHHNHRHNLQEHYLVRRQAVDLAPASARRVYVDVAVPSTSAAGVYRGSLTVAGADGAALATIPLAVEVLPLELARPPVFFAACWDLPALGAYGIDGPFAAAKMDAAPRLSLSGMAWMHEWPFKKDQPPAVQAGTAEVYEQLAAAREPFWCIDAMRHAMEHSARFTWGFWLWRSGAAGRLTALGPAGGQVGAGAYHTLANGNSANVYRALIDSQTSGQYNPSRDLLLLREGIADCRYIYALDRLIADCQARQAGGAALEAAVTFRDALRKDLSLNLKDYYLMRQGSYSEDWFPRPENPWTPEKFDATRRACADHMIALQKAAPATAAAGR